MKLLKMVGILEIRQRKNLKYLSSRQALEDIAAFIKAMNTKYGYANPRWIVYGGSYSGHCFMAFTISMREKSKTISKSSAF